MAAITLAAIRSDAAYLDGAIPPSANRKTPMPLAQLRLRPAAHRARSTRDRDVSRTTILAITAKAG